MQIRIAPSLGDLEGHPNDIWGTAPYISETFPTVFFGMYGLRDFFALWNHKGERHILWAGSDIRHLIGGYFLDVEGKMRIEPRQLTPFLNKYCTNWVENETEYLALANLGIYAQIVPSFLGKVEDFPLHFVVDKPVKLYTSVSGNDFDLYGWHLIPELARANPDVEFHCYGNTIEPPFQLAYRTNIILHGRVPKEVMNREIKNMTGALRLTEFDGFSEILAKSVLMGQYPVSLIEYPHMLLPRDIGKLKDKRMPNFAGRDHYLKILNQYPWNLKK